MASSKFEITTLADQELVPYLMDKLLVIANEAISSRGVFILGVSGTKLIHFKIKNEAYLFYYAFLCICCFQIMFVLY